MGKIMFVLGTRPEILKCASTIINLKKEDKHEIIICATGQHAEIADEAYKMFDIQPKYNLCAMSDGQSLNELLSKMIKRLETPILVESPDLLVVYGDTHTTIAGAMAGFYANIPILHMEAGARSGNIREPYPEEMNRIISDKLSTYHMCQCKSHIKNLKNEGIKGGVEIGNTSIDAALMISDKLKIKKEDVIIFTMHRRENLGKGVNELILAIRMLSQVFKKYTFIVVTHPNPKTHKPLIEGLKDIKNVKLVPPLGYKEFITIMKAAKFIVTDSGGASQESPSLGTPALLLRNVTENPELIKANVNKLIGTKYQDIYDNCKRLITNDKEYKAMLGKNPYGEGESYKKVIKEINKIMRKTI